MITIKIKRNENMNRVLQRFKAAVMSEGTMKTVKNKSRFVKPCIRRKLKSEEATRQKKKDEMKLIRQALNDEKEWH
jgi:small subunit ribosomal protein S21|tara:strand:+ start:2017 stop:2244 length:228 start_codon:yes stop_codon:yes gene_type:complete